jgi:hypothetical protein
MILAQLSPKRDLTPPLVPAPLSSIQLPCNLLVEHVIDETQGGKYGDSSPTIWLPPSFAPLFQSAGSYLLIACHGVVGTTLFGCYSCLLGSHEFISRSLCEANFPTSFLPTRCWRCQGYQGERQPLYNLTVSRVQSQQQGGRRYMHLQSCHHGTDSFAPTILFL